MFDEFFAHEDNDIAIGSLADCCEMLDATVLLMVKLEANLCGIRGVDDELDELISTRKEVESLAKLFHDQLRKKVMWRRDNKNVK